MGRVSELSPAARAGVSSLAGVCRGGGNAPMRHAAAPIGAQKTSVAGSRGLVKRATKRSIANTELPKGPVHQSLLVLWLGLDNALSARLT